MKPVTAVYIEPVDSLAELEESLRRDPTGILLGRCDEALRKFYAAEILGCRIGICSQGVGIQPQVIRGGEGATIWVGYNSRIESINASECSRKFVVDLDSIFLSFIQVMADGSVIVAHELGVERIDSGGAILWNVTTTIIESVRDKGDRLLVAAEEECVVIDKETGRQQLI